MDGWRFVIGVALLLGGIGLLAGTRWAMRRGTHPAQQVVLVAPFTLGTGVLICGAFLVLTAAG